jgi:hypothetical protein
MNRHFSLLLQHGANPNAVNISSVTPLHFAAAINAVDVIRMFLEAGARVTAYDMFVRSPADYAILNGPSTAFRVLSKSHNGHLSICGNFGRRQNGGRGISRKRRSHQVSCTQWRECLFAGTTTSLRDISLNLWRSVVTFILI